MEIEISGVGLGFGLFCVGVGLVSMGYYIGNGLQNFHHPKNEIDFYTFLKENDLEMFLNLSSNEIKVLINEHPDIPKVMLRALLHFVVKAL